MSQAIRIALVLAAVVAIVASVGTLVVYISDGLTQAFPMLNSAIISIAPYASWGRRVLNALVGNAAIAGILIFFIISMPILYFFTGLVSRIFRLIIGQ